MSRVDWAARLDPAALEYRPCRVWIPVAPPSADRAGDHAAEDARIRAPRRLALHVPPQDGARLPVRLPALLAEVDARPGDSVTVDVGGARPHLTGVGVLLAALWRAVGPQGSVTLAGMPEATLSALRRLELTPDAVRADVFGALRAPERPAAEAVPPRLPVPTPRQRVSDEVRTASTAAAA